MMETSTFALNLLADLFAADKKITKKNPRPRNSTPKVVKNVSASPSIQSTPLLNQNQSIQYTQPAISRAPPFQLPIWFSTKEPNPVKRESEEDAPPNCNPNVSKLRVTGNRQKIDFCHVCQTSLTTNGSRSQGPRRHILKDHLMKKMYLCPCCEFGSNYDKSHVSAHMKKMHPGATDAVICLDKHTYHEEEAVWMDLCFGRKSQATVLDVPQPVQVPVAPFGFPPVPKAVPAVPTVVPVTSQIEVPATPQIEVPATPQTEPPKQRKHRAVNRGVNSIKRASANSSPETPPFYQATMEDYYQTIINQVLRMQQDLNGS